MRPSAIRSTSARDSLRAWKEIWMPLVVGGSACTNINAHIAAGHSLQPLFFCSCGQQGMSLGIADTEVTCIIAVKGTSFAATGPASGCKTSPATTKAASKRQMNRYKTIISLSHGTGSPERSAASQIRQRSFRQVKAPQKHIVNWAIWNRVACSAWAIATRIDEFQRPYSETTCCQALVSIGGGPRQSSICYLRLCRLPGWTTRQ